MSRALRASMVVGLAAVLAAVLAGCGTSASTTPGLIVGSDGGTPQVYAAIGASETIGAGIDDDPLRLRDAWPQLFFNAALPRASTYYNVGVGGSTTADALAAQVPAALRLQPTVVTVWLNVDDLVHGVSAPTYEQQLDSVVSKLRQSGRTIVLVATTPWLDHLPAYLACRPAAPGGIGCLLGPEAMLPDPATVNALVDQYNAAIARVVQRRGAVLVDLHAQGEVPDTHPDWIGSDGFHPSAHGHAEVARLFAAAYRSAAGS